MTDITPVTAEGAAGGDRIDMLARARFGRCRSRQAGQFRQCGAVLSEDEYAQALTAYLVQLACAEPYAARGLAMQALQPADDDRKPLARALLDARAGEEGCRGVALLPERTLEQLERFTLQQTAPQPR